jgi:hypothetical protein
MRERNSQRFERLDNVRLSFAACEHNLAAVMLRITRGYKNMHQKCICKDKSSNNDGGDKEKTTTGA